MKHCLITISLTVLLLFSGAAGYCAILRVPSAYLNIQAGINAASHGDTVLVADGTYANTGNKNIDFNGKSILLTSEHGANWCFIDCQGTGRAFFFHNNEDQNAIVSGFTIQNGLVNNEYGSGILISHSDPSIVNCIISGCGSSSACPKGGGIALVSAIPVIFNCIIVGCGAIEAGGGIYCENSNPLLVDCPVIDIHINYGILVYEEVNKNEIKSPAHRINN